MEKQKYRLEHKSFKVNIEIEHWEASIEDWVFDFDGIELVINLGNIVFFHWGYEDRGVALDDDGEGLCEELGIPK